MPVQFPSCQWPADFSERGPAEDPSILLLGTARIARASMQIVAIRTSRDSARLPDYRSEVPRECYEVNGLATLLEQALEDLEYLADEFVEVTGDDNSEIVELTTCAYTIFALPSRADAV